MVVKLRRAARVSVNMPRATSKSSPAVSRAHGVKPFPRPVGQDAHELMELAVDAAQSRHLPEFLERFASRAARMLDSAWGGVAVFRGRETDLYQANRAEVALEPAQQSALIRLAREGRREIETLKLSSEPALSKVSISDVPGSGPGSVVLVPIMASDHEILGSLCLIRGAKILDDAERRLLQALASHAALSLENFRRFSQLERSKRQWVEDIDAISDYIVVHDRSWRIVRTNRSLASHLGVPPVALVGEAMSSLRQIAESGSELPCPFCRDTQQPREEYVVA